MSGMIPRPFIDELLSRIDIVEFIDSHIPLKKQGTSFVACCPFHNEKTPSFNVIARKQFYHCFGCGASGNAISFAIDYLHQNFPEAIETLAARAGMEVPREGAAQKTPHFHGLYQLLEKVTLFYQEQLKTHGEKAILYLKQRGINGNIAKKFQIGYAPGGWHTLESTFKSNSLDLIASGMLVTRDDGKTHDRYRDRVMYPIHDRHGRIIGFGGRSIDPTQKPKYLNSPETPLFQKSRELYGLHQILSTNEPIAHIVIVEGYMDVIALAQFGVTNAVATLGTATSGYHIQLLSKHTKQLIFCFDGDEAGKKAAWRALESSLPHLNSGLDASFIFLPEGQDPDSLIREEGPELFLERLTKAMPLNQFFFNTLTQSIDTSTLAGKSLLINNIKPYLVKMSDGPYRQLIIDSLSRLTRIDTDRLNQLTASKSDEKLPEKHQPIQRSPARIAIAILLQNPDIYKHNASALTSNRINEVQHPILKRLLQVIAESRDINTGTLIEAFRESDEFNALSKLAVWDHQVPEHALSGEFLDTLLFLGKQAHESKIHELLTQSRNQGLSEEEQLTLQLLLKQRHHVVENHSSTD